MCRGRSVDDCAPRLRRRRSSSYCSLKAYWATVWTMYPIGLRQHNPYHTHKRWPTFSPTYSFAARIRRLPPPHVHPSLSSTPDLDSRGHPPLHAIANFAFLQSSGALQFTQSPSHLDKSPSRFVDSNASIEPNTNIEEKCKVRTISTPIQESIKLTLLSFSDVLLVMAVVILKKSEYTRADRYDSEKDVKGDKIIE